MREIEPSLQPPGAGLPGPELFVVRRLLLPILRRTKSWAAMDTLFLDEGRRVLDVLDALPPERAQARVLVKRVAGMEDSSRYWSAVMIVEHLNIVGGGIRDTIRRLRLGETGLPTAKTEDVKPAGVASIEKVRGGFVALLDATGQAGPSIARGVGPTRPHAWFGPMDAFAWHGLLAAHQQLHRKQMERVRDGLARA